MYGKLDNSKQIYKENLSLPMYPGISKEKLDYVINFFKNLVN